MGNLILWPARGICLSLLKSRAAELTLWQTPRCRYGGKSRSHQETAYEYLQDHKRPGDRIRYDVIEIMMLFGHFQLNHLKNYL